MSTNLPDPTSPADQPRELVWPEWVYPYQAGAVGGLLGGLTIAAIGLAYGLSSGIFVGDLANSWLPINVVAAVVLRDMQTMPVEELGRFNLFAVVVAGMIHLIMSVGLGEMFSFLLPALPGRPLYWGPVIGPLLWIAAFVAALPIINPVMTVHIEPISFGLANVLYGLVLGWWIDRTPMIQVEH